MHRGSSEWIRNLAQLYFPAYARTGLLLAAVISSLGSANAAANDRTVDNDSRRVAVRNTLPTDRSYREDGPFPLGEPPSANTWRPAPDEGRGMPDDFGLYAPSPSDQPVVPLVIEPEATIDGPVQSKLPANLAALMRPKIAYAGEFSLGNNDFSYQSDDVSLRIPTYPIFGPPPPMVIAGFSFTQFPEGAAYDLQDELYDVSLGAAWMRRINDRWMLRMTASAAYASDGNNNSSDAWQFRGGVFALYQQNDAFQWVFGALASGRRDLPVIPAAGAIWQPNPQLRVDLLLPRPRISWLAADIFDTHTQRHLTWLPFSIPRPACGVTGHRQRWLYLQGGFTGGTWAFERPSGTDDVMTYREWRVALGWETVPAKQPGEFIALGPTLGFEVAYSFGRSFEFDSGAPDIDPEGNLLLRVLVRL